MEETSGHSVEVLFLRFTDSFVGWVLVTGRGSAASLNSSLDFLRT